MKDKYTYLGQIFKCNQHINIDITKGGITMEQKQLRDAGLDDLEKQMILWCKGKCKPNITIAHLYAEWSGCDLETYDGDLFYTPLTRIFTKLVELKLVRLNDFFDNMVCCFRPQYKSNREKIVEEIIALIAISYVYNDTYNLNLGEVWEEFRKERATVNNQE